MIDENIVSLIQNKVGVSKQACINTLALLQDGNTIPFIARYRKERTFNLDEVQIQDIAKWEKYFTDLSARKITVLEAIKEQDKLTDVLSKAIENCFDAIILEDMYAPYKKKRKTRADVARERGLEPLAKIIMAQCDSNIDKTANKFISEQVLDEKAAIEGASDIIAEWVSEDINVRERLRETYRRYATIESKVVKTKVADAQQYKDYFEYIELLHKCPSHRFLAINRGANEGLLRLSLVIDRERAEEYLNKKFIKQNSTTQAILKNALSDSLYRLIMPSIELNILSESKVKADIEAIKIFTTNLYQLLMASPLGSKTILAVDPGFRTGCKLAVIDELGNLVYHTAIFPHEPQKQLPQSTQVIHEIVAKYNVEAIAIGNGTASRESVDFLEQCKLPKHIEIYIVSESGASVYSASEVSREEFPNHDVTVRGAVSIGRRLMDPLAELVKIDAKAIGVGQYQHDVNQNMLQESLDQTVISCVNKVGVNLNTASKYLLTYISGLGQSLAANIVQFRESHGKFHSREQLLQVPRLGAKAYEQCAGFLRIKDGVNALDNTAVHPERYKLVQQLAKKLNTTLEELVQNPSQLRNIDLNLFVNDEVGLPTLKDIMLEIEKPGLDPRGQADNIHFDEAVRKMEDLREGMILHGIVTNITAFGAFIDIGVKQDGMVHKSQMADQFVHNPADIVHLTQKVKVKVLDVDAARKRINLSMKDL